MNNYKSFKSEALKAIDILTDDCQNWIDWDKTDGKNWQAMVDQLNIIKGYVENE